MPAWLIIAIVIIIFALSSKSNNSTEAENNAVTASQMQVSANDELKKRCQSCGSRCDDECNSPPPLITRE